MKKYRTSIYVGTDANGNKKRIYISANSPEELQKKVIIKKEDLRRGAYKEKSAYIDDWADQWLEKYRIPSGISTGTINQYKAAIGHLKREFGHLKFVDISLSRFQEFIYNLAKMNPNTGKPAAKQTLQNVVKVAKSICVYARSNNIDVPDFTSAVIIPKNAPEEKRRALTEEEQNWIIETSHRCQLPAMIMMFAGLRRSEVIPLLWEDIDLKNGIISINKTVDLQNNIAELRFFGKSDAAIREINIPPVLVDYLKKYKKENNVTYGLVCLKISGGYHSKSSFTKMWNSYLLDLNIKYGFPGRNLSKYNPKRIPMKIEHFTPHYLRHTFATILYLQGVDVVTAKQLMGHADIQTTINRYTDIKNNRYSVSKSYKDKLEKEYKVIPNNHY